MNKNELEKLFDKQDFEETSWLYENRETFISLEKVKDFVFWQMLTEIVKSLTEIKDGDRELISNNADEFWNYEDWYLERNEDIKTKVKDLYWINI